METQYVSPYRQLLAERQRLFYAAVEAGEYKPYVHPWDTSPLFLMLGAILFIPLLPPRLQRPASYAAYAAIMWETVRVMAHSKMLTFAGGYGIGLRSVWVAIMSFALLICNDVGRDFWRIEARPLPNGRLKDEADGHANGSAAITSGSQSPPRVNVRRRRVSSVCTARDVNQMDFAGSEQAATRPYTLVWQGYPLNGNWGHRLDWAVDLATSFRGVGWSHRIPSAGPIDIPLPKVPTIGQNTPADHASGDTTPTAVSKRSLRALQLQALQDFVSGYLLLDFLKTIMITDPYFLGVASLESPAPWNWLAVANDTIPIATRTVRLAVGLAGVIMALNFIFSLNALFFATVLPQLVDVSKMTKAPFLEPWLYPPQWQPLTTSVLATGLAGFWGRCWHQMFRYGIAEPSRILIEKLKIDRRGSTARTIQLLTAFALSGSIHAGGSYTTISLAPRYPLSGPMLFFLLQAAGILLQSWTVEFLHRQVPQVKSQPRVVGQVANLLFVTVFLYITAPLLADDFARCGLWFFEPVPISPLRAMGFGPGGKDEGWFTWYQDGARWVGWWNDDRWWRRGLAIW